jgi:hypothetical protein
MRCFYHGDVEAVAVCKSCFRAICHDCSTEAGSSTACRNRCEADVIAIDELRRRSARLTVGTTYLYYGIGVFFILMGLPTFLGGLLSIGTKEPNPVGIFMGLVFMAGGISSFWFARRHRK